jgi:SAM-dependent methyltransferase
VGEKQLAFLKEYAAKEKTPNVTVVAGAERSTNLPAGCCDAILVRDAYHHFTQPEDLVRSVAAALKPGGRLAIIDFRPRPNSEIPAGVPANRLGHGVPIEVVTKEVGAALTHVRTIEAWAPNGTQADLFLVLFRKP